MPPRFKVGDTVRITPPPGAPSDWRPRHGSVPMGEGFGRITEFGSNFTSHYAFIDFVGYGQWAVDLNDLAHMEQQNVSAPAHGREW